jgi:hypothetical protein
MPLWVMLKIPSTFGGTMLAISSNSHGFSQFSQSLAQIPTLQRGNCGISVVLLQ